MKTLLFYEIDDIEYAQFIKPEQIDIEEKPAAIFYMYNNDEMVIDNKLIKEKILKNKTSGFYYLAMKKDDKFLGYTILPIDKDTVLNISTEAELTEVELTEAETLKQHHVTDDPIAGIERFQKDRLLDKQPFDFKTEVLNILEELVEMTGEESAAARRIAKDIFKNYFENKLIVDKEELVDCFADIQVFSIGSIMKLGYNPKCVLTEVGRVINSRVGRIIDGKFVKDKSPEAVAKWYEANFSKCEVKDV